MVPGLVWSLSRWICYGSSRTVVGLVPRDTRRQLEPLRAQLSVCESEQPRPVLPEQQPRVPPRPGADSVRGQALRSRQSRRDGRTRQGLAGELGILGVLGLLGALSVFCAGVPGEWHSVAFRFPPLIPVPFRFSRQSRRDERTR